MSGTIDFSAQKRERLNRKTVVEKKAGGGGGSVMSGADIKTAYEGEADTNAYTDTEKTKLGTVDSNADVTADNAPKTHAMSTHTDEGALSTKDTVGSAEIDNDAVTYAKIQNVVADKRILGRTSGANGVVEELTVAQVLTMLSVQSGSTDDQTGAEIKTLYEAEANAFTDAKNTKLAGIDTGAKDDQTGAEIKTAYEGEADTNAYNDAAVTKLAGIDSGAKDDQTGAEIKTAYQAEANAFTDTKNTKLSGIDTGAKDDQTGAEIKTAYEGEADTNAYNDAAVTKLAGIDTGAKDDQTGAEIKTAYQAEANAFTDTKNTKLAGIDSGAKDDQTGAEIKTAYQAEANAFTDTKNTKLSGIDTGADVGNDNEPAVVSCHNATGSSIAIRSVCYISGDQSGVPQITKAQADAEANAKGLLVITMAAIGNGAAGNCRILGKVSGFSGLTAGAIQYLSDDTAGAIEETATVTATEINRIVGYALSTTVLWFNPDISYIEVPA